MPAIKSGGMSQAYPDSPTCSGEIAAPPAAYPLKPLRQNSTPFSPGSALSRQLSEGQNVVGGDMSEDPSLRPPDIEHAAVMDDPRKWSYRKKHFILFIISFASMGGALTASIMFPALQSLQQDLRVSEEYLTATVAIFILFQGVVPIWWSALSEIRGRKLVYVASNITYGIGTIVASTAQNGPTFFAMRVFQAIGGSAVLSIGAGSLADIFEPHERGQKLGWYYIAPLLGPSFGSLLGGALTSASNWRATFYFLIGYAVLCIISFIFLPDTWRPQRSRAYQTALKRAVQHQNKRSGSKTNTPNASTDALNKLGQSQTEPVKLSLRDVNPLSAVGAVMRVPLNFVSIFFSGLLFAFQYCLSYTASQSFSSAPYDYDALKVGLVLLTLGVGSMCGSVLGGRYSDFVFRKLKAANNGVPEPEMRIESTKFVIPVLPLCLIAYGWLVRYTVPIYYICISLFLIGLSSIWIYSSTLAYIVDKNVGRSSSAVACNSAMRGSLACLAAFLANPIIKGVGNGALYTGWAVLLSLNYLALLIMANKSRKWRKA